MPCWRKKEAKLRDEKKSCEKDENSLKIRNKLGLNWAKLRTR